MWGLEPIIHIILWMFFITGEVISLALLKGSYSYPSHYISFYLLNILLFYSYVWALFRILEKPLLPWLWVILIFMTAMVLYVGIAGLLTNLLTKAPYRGSIIDTFDKRFIVSTSWRGFYFMLFGTGYVAVKRNSQRRINELARAVEIAQLKEQVITAEKAFLRSQINPHFLFNTLSFINHSTKHYPENARTAITLLSEIMDYALESSKGEYVLLSEEVEQIENMIALDRLRFGDKLNLVFQKKSDCTQMRIVPLILLTLVENVLKHGNLLHKTHPTVIVLSCTEKSLTFLTSNPFDPGKHPKGTQTGLKNIEARLLNTYPRKHLFTSRIEDDIFITELTIDLTNHNPSS